MSEAEAVASTGSIGWAPTDRQLADAARLTAAALLRHPVRARLLRRPVPSVVPPVGRIDVHA